MRFDTVIIGGGLAGLVCGLQLQRAGQRTAVVSAGQSSLHFMSGAFGLLGSVQGREVQNPVQEVGHLPQGHPYRCLGGAFERYADAAKGMLESIGLRLYGDCRENHYRLSPIGRVMPSWLSMEELLPIAKAEDVVNRRVGVVTFAGFLDFPAALLGDSLRRQGAQVEELTLELPSLVAARESVTEFRSVHVAREFTKESAIKELIEALTDWSRGVDWLLLPAVFGMGEGGEMLQRLRDSLQCELGCVATLPPSVLGMRVDAALKRGYTAAGGLLVENSVAERAELQGRRAEWLQTSSLGEDLLYADAFVHAGGKFHSKGLQSDRQGIREGLFGGDVAFDAAREEWHCSDFFANHAFLHYGVQTDSDYRALVKGQVMENVYVIGSLLGGCDSLAEGSGAGVALLTALRVADIIAKGQGYGA